MSDQVNILLNFLQNVTFYILSVCPRNSTINIILKQKLSNKYISYQEPMKTIERFGWEQSLKSIEIIPEHWEYIWLNSVVLQNEQTIDAEIIRHAVNCLYSVLLRLWLN